MSNSVYKQNKHKEIKKVWQPHEEQPEVRKPYSYNVKTKEECGNVECGKCGNTESTDCGNADGRGFNLCVVPLFRNLVSVISESQKDLGR